MSREDVIKISENGRNLTPQQKYDKENTKTYAVKVMKNTEADIYKKLESLDNKSGYIKKLIRNDIEDSDDGQKYAQGGMTNYQFKVFLKMLKMKAEVSSNEEFIKMLDNFINEL